MEELARWIVLRTAVLLDGGVFRVEEMEARSPGSGRSGVFFRLVAGDWVNVVPVTLEGRIVLVRQWRAGDGRVTWEIPGGQVDAGETPSEAARRELLEETGYGGGDLLSLGAVNPNPALFGNRCHTFLARGVRRIDRPAPEGSEEVSVEVVAPARLEELVATGAIDHALVLAALYWHDRFGRGLPAPRRGGDGPAG